MYELNAEKQYRSVINRIAGTMLIFLALTNTLAMIGMGLNLLWEEYLVEIAAEIATSVTDGVVYVLSFMLPVCFYRLMSQGKINEPMKLAPRLPRATFAYIFAGMAVILAAAYLNYYMISFTNYEEFAAENLWVDTYDTPHAIILSFVTLAIIPAFVEEFLFRGLIQSNLRPFGRGTAIVGSAVLFGLMHQNIQQIFFATVAGLVLGYLYEVTDSIWCGILLHLLNNGFSVFESAIVERWNETAAERVCTLAEGAIFGIGAICLIWLICRKKQEPDFSHGCFGQTFPMSPDYAPFELPGKQKVKLFFSPMMIAFTAITTSTMILYLVIALVMYGG
ncbi:MAG: CPBP family intramembrane metalloprotease [Clostridia bacterium]|nr:CPBP family intramembrane metalloprotease [Clostridia bacterium]